jgi:hypothetical protein
MPQPQFSPFPTAPQLPFGARLTPTDTLGGWSVYGPAPLVALLGLLARRGW